MGDYGSMSCSPHTESCTGSYSDSSEVASWEDYVAEDGSLFYVEYNTVVTASTTGSSMGHQEQHSVPSSTVDFVQGSNGGLRVAKKGGRRRQNAANGGISKGGGASGAVDPALTSTSSSHGSNQKKEKGELKFGNVLKREENSKILELVITAADRYRFGRRSTAVESILGFRVIPYHDQPECLMLDSFMHDIPSLNECNNDSSNSNANSIDNDSGNANSNGNADGTYKLKPIGRGDWFKSLDNIEVHTSNLEDILLQFLEPTKVILKFQAYEVDRSERNDYNASEASRFTTVRRKIENYSIFSNQFEELFQGFFSNSNSSGSGKDNSEEMREDHQMNTTLTLSDVNATGGDHVKDYVKNHVNNEHDHHNHNNGIDNGEGDDRPNSTDNGKPDVTVIPFAMLILPPECYQNDKHKNSLFYYPYNNRNFLYKSRGSFLTLNTVLCEELKTKPTLSRLTYGKWEYNVCYRSLNGFLVLFSFPCTRLNMIQSNQRADELIAYLHFMYIYSNMNLDSFNDMEFRRNLHDFCNIQYIRILIHDRLLILHQDANRFKESRHLPLPKEAQLRIFDALSEMEAMDYRNWNDEPLHTHREFFINGSVLFYNHFLLVTQMSLESRQCVEAFLRSRGVFDFITHHNVKELYIWEEVTPPKCNGRFFLAVCGRDHLMLAVILKLFEAANLEVDDKVQPSLFYIEEIQETLEHLIQCGIESLSMFWSISNKRPEALERFFSLSDTNNEKDTLKKGDNFLKQKLILGSVNGIGGGKELLNTQHPHHHLHHAHYPHHPHVSSRGATSVAGEEDGQPGTSLGGSSVHSLTPSEDDSSKKKHVIPLTNANADDSDSNSDWENFTEQNPHHYGANNIDTPYQITESMWKEISNVIPVKISSGWHNAIYHFIYIDNVNNTIFSPLTASGDIAPFTSRIFSIFQQIQHNLHSQRTMIGGRQGRTNKVSTSAGGEQTPRPSILEHGITLQMSKTIDVNGHQTEEVSVRLAITGRVFSSPPREIYICHRPEVPQNMIELAFRLSFFPSG